MRWWGAATVQRTLVGYRTMWLAGRFGGGKTYLAFALGRWLYASGYVDHVVSNIESEMCVDPLSLWIRPRERSGRRIDARRNYECERLEVLGSERVARAAGWRPGMANVAMVFDEAWIYLDAREWSKNVGQTIGAFLRKYNLYLLLPSVWAVDKRFRRLSCQRVLNCQAFGLPLWVYKYSLQQGFVEDTGAFGVWRPGSLFGMYDHLATPSDSGGILGAMELLSEREAVSTEFTGDIADYDGIQHRGTKRVKRSSR